MSDIDNDLLDLAGGDSGDEGSISEGRDRSETPRRDLKTTSSKKTSRRSRQDASEDEGEAFSEPGSPNSLASAAMDESDSDEEPPARTRAPPAATGGEDEKYPVDGKYVSHSEKARIEALPELEREQILADRMMEIDRQRQNRLLRQMVENEERKQSQKHKKRSADTAELEDEDDRKTTTRQRVGKGESAMDTLRRARLEKQKRKENQERRRDSYSPRRRSRSPDRDASDDDFVRGSRSPEPEATRDVPPPDLRDFERVRLGRNEFSQVCHTPGFEDAITGCYIRLSVGPHPETGIEQYRMALIKGFTTSRPYALNGPGGSFITDQYVRAAHGKSIKEFPFIAASSGKFSDAELHRYTVTCQNEGLTLPTKLFLSDKVDEINNLISHKWTNEEIKQRLNRRAEMKRRFDPAERQRVAQKLEEAREKGDDEKADALQEQLDNMGAQRLAFRTSLAPTKSTTTQQHTEQDRLAERNRENRRLNAEAVRKAQLKEKARIREIEAAIERGEIVEDDSSRRVRTKAKFIHNVNEKAEQKAGSNGATPTNGSTPSNNGTKSMPAHLAKLQLEQQTEAKGVPTIHKPLMDDDVIGSLDLDIDIDI
ncbi:uncharacterized protein J7T54_003972 [Emericellopsis cladophorae]|uniref:Plus3 domain-containing protein n=1 Tax=Emericellopsis cladophorae TaxID=2686198 RepID=A0A9P9Y1E5_9HYPO|nr:uncharacterized protein J7T54_003972 [Emericellopsis cladophorae]KAI6781706.1 hypothetical protein J7T54_003972 [Emericellopsis cladophorae]